MKQNKFWSALLIVLLLSACGSSTGTLKGAILNCGSPVADATVTMYVGSDPQAETVTDSSGQYTFDEVKPGDYMLSAKWNDIYLISPGHTTIKAGKTTEFNMDFENGGQVCP